MFSVVGSPPRRSDRNAIIAMGIVAASVGMDKGNTEHDPLELPYTMTTHGCREDMRVFPVRGKVAMIPFLDSVATEDFTWIEGHVTEEDAKLLIAATK